MAAANTMYRCVGPDLQFRTSPNPLSSRPIFKETGHQWTVRLGMERPAFPERTLRNIGPAGLVRLDVGPPDHFAPLLGVGCDELVEVGRRARRRRAAEVDQPCLQLRIVETNVDLFVELVDDFNRRFLRCTEAEYRAGFVTWDEVAHGRDIW